ncbi:MAG: hypothetical protein RLZZ490_457 [Cyanobacteriota bacterium]|jgi:hypothetical protein
MLNRLYRKNLVTLLLCSFCAGPILTVAPPSLAQTERQVLTTQQKQDLVQRSEEVITLANQGDFARALSYLAPEVKAYLTPEMLQRVWETELIEQTGAFESITGSKIIDVINADIVTLTVKFAQRSEDIQFIFNKSQELIGITLPSSLSIDEISEAFVMNLSKGDYGASRGFLNPLFKTEIFADKLETEWQNELASYGPFEEVVDVKVKPGSTFDAPDVAIVTIAFENETRDYFFFFDSNRKIVNIDFVVD